MKTPAVLKGLGYAVLAIGVIGGLVWLTVGARDVNVTLPGWLLALALLAGGVVVGAVLVGFGRNLELLEDISRNTRR